MVVKEAQFLKILARQNGQNQTNVAKFPKHFVMGVLGPCSK